jgi:hypothetical protein
MQRIWEKKDRKRAGLNRLTENVEDKGVRP